MSKIIETGLVLRHETKFDKIRKIINRIFFYEEYYLEESFNELLGKRKINTSKIVIPTEIGVRNERKNFL